MLDIYASRSGHPTATYGGVALHSRYDPTEEARRFVQGATREAAPGTLLILGEGIGHLARAARRLHPQARVLALYYATELWAASPREEHASWHPGSGLTILGFLRAELSELDAEGMEILVWPASHALFAALAREALEATSQIARELSGSISTTARSGRRWLANAARNFLFGPDPLVGVPLEPGLPVLLAASGPSLRLSTGLLRELRRSIALWALPSAVEHLLAVGLVPDLVLVTDPVYYSVYHLHAARGCGLTVVLPLSAAAGVWRISPRVAYLPQPSFFEPPLVAALGGGLPTVPSHGTVAGTALELALRLTASAPVPIVFAGLDLCYEDVESHCRPNAFEHFLLPGDGRLHPAHHRRCADALEQAPERLPGSRARTSGPLRTYAGWFAAGDPRWSGRVRRLLPSSVALPAIPPITPSELRSGCPPPGFRPRSAALETRPAMGTGERAAVLGGLLAGWRKTMCDASSSLPPPAQALAIARTLGVSGLLETRRFARRGEAAKAREAWSRTASDVDGFLASLELTVARARHG